MTKINRKSRTATLSLRDSRILCGPETSNGPDLHEASSRVRDEVQAVADKIGQNIEIYACARYGGARWEVCYPLG